MGEPILPTDGGPRPIHPDGTPAKQPPTPTPTPLQRLAAECPRRIMAALHRCDFVHYSRGAGGRVHCFGVDSEVGEGWVATESQSALWAEQDEAEADKEGGEE